MELIESFLGPAVKFFPVNYAESSRFPAQPDVFGNAEILYQRQLLINHRNACLFRIADTGKAADRAFQQYLSVVFGIRINAGENLDQGGFAGTVFPDQRMDFTGM